MSIRNLRVWKFLSKKCKQFSENLWLQIFYLKIIINPTFCKILLNLSRELLYLVGVGGGLKVNLFKPVQWIVRFIPFYFEDLLP